MGTGGPPYTNALRPRITIKTINGSDTLYTYDSFLGSNPINVVYCDTEGAINESGTFNIIIADHNNVIPKDNIHSVKVFVELGKTSTSYEHFMIGYGDIFSIDRPQTNAQLYNLTGFGSAILASRLFIHRRETYRRDESDAKIYNIVDNALTKRLWRPLKKQDESIEDITGWSPDGISTKVNTPFTVLNKPFTYFSDLLNELCDITGAVWFIDFTGGEETFTLSYKPDLMTKVTIKSGDLADKVNDDPTRISYIKTAFRVEDNTTTEAGTINRLFSVTVADKERVFELTDGTGSSNLTFKALAQQVIINNDARRIDSIELRLSNDGEVESPNSRVNGDIVLDNGSNKPTGTILDEFHIDLGSIQDQANWIEVPLDISAKALDVAQAKIWVRLFQRSGITGDPNHDTSNIIKWHHSNAFNATQSYYSGSAAGGDVDKKKSLSWATTNQGPLYTVRVNSDIRRLFSRTNGASKNRIGLREAFIPTDFLSDPRDVTRYLSLNLSQSSKGRRGIADFRVTVPDNFLFKPHQLVSLHDGLSDIDDVLDVQRVRYVMGSAQGDPQIGTLHAELTLSGLYNTLLGACTCL